MSRSVTIRGDGYVLRGSLYAPRKLLGPSPAVLLIHGWTGSRSDLAGLPEGLVAAGFVVLAFDLRGHGESPGDRERLPLTAYGADVVAAYDFLAGREEVRAEAVSVCGESLGGHLALLLTTERPVRALALRVPIDIPDSAEDLPGPVIERSEELQTFLAAPQPPDASRTLRGLHHFPGDVLILEAGQDEGIPHAAIQSYVDAVPDRRRLTYVLVGHASHDIPSEPASLADFDAMTLAWLRHHARAPS